MPRFVQLVVGPAGVGKSTYCKTIQDHCSASKRRMHVANLDPAAEHFDYECAFDIRDLVSLEEVMEELNFGPNGGLVYCMEYLFKHSEWLYERMEEFGEDDYVILDCPGQVELYSHLPVMRNIVELLQQWDYRILSVYLLDALFVLDSAKFISGCMLSLSCMMQLSLPHINVITKCDMADKEAVARILDAEGATMINMIPQQQTVHPRFQALTAAMSSVIDDYMMVSFVMLDQSDEETIDNVLMHCDRAVQFGEDAEPTEPVDDDGDDGGNFGEEVMGGGSGGGAF